LGNSTIRVDKQPRIDKRGYFVSLDFTNFNGDFSVKGYYGANIGGLGLTNYFRQLFDKYNLG
jgi:hypothetical protein